MAAEHSKIWHDEKVAQLLESMLQGTVAEIKPQFNLQSESGFFYPVVDELLGTMGEEAKAILESLADENILVRKFFDKFLRCPQCQSMNLRPVYYCFRCGSGNIVRGRMLEHLPCKYVGTEDEFLVRGKLVCPNCKKELHNLDTDYRSLGIMYKCHDCQEISSYPAVRWRCLKCSSLTSVEKVLEVNAYSYSLNEEERNWLGFEIKPRFQLVRFLQDKGYEVKDNARVRGKSGAEHSFDMLATRDAGVLTHQIAIGIVIGTDKIGLDKLFDFDDKAYDCGINYKVFIAIPGVTIEAEQLAARQRIRILGVTELEAFLTDGMLPPLAQESGAEAAKYPFQFKSRSGLVEYLQGCGYEMKQNARVKGRSGAEHTFDLLASRDDGIIVHNIAIGVEVSGEPVEVERVFNFDDKAYDCGITDKVLIVVPALTKEARRFAQRQNINVFEVQAIEPDE